LARSDLWTPTKNCAFFALSVWNAVAGADAITLKGLPTPSALNRKIKEFADAGTDRAFELCGTDIGYYDKAGRYVACRYAGV
jgi:hypothetical protein